ncbi:hypothetical protein F4813DRAFT_231483 [Daldinia decipiens]|uniref:uncharacterized protein n=1 Tax=Daldinia decipiens TaxID=326647 RepID=UPI0020C3A5BB|nr:uncharacterized protein F4813DRAFT_231483 [Daldinia decipiens]KAI1661503.1 hypothetical protein F4813DRAFT_231483 [Daldinia decipiens]
MADEIRQTPVPVPHVYGQPALTTDTATPPTTTASSLAGDTAAMTIEQPPLAPSTEQAASPAPTTTTTTTNNAAAPTTTTAPAPATTPSNAPSPSPAAAAATTTTTTAPPARTGTPLRATNGQQEANSSSRAASQHPDPGFTMPAEAPPHGAPVRQYLNSKVTGPLLDGMKMIAKEQPKDPLRALGEYLLQRSKELESTT